jgi:hypothetical protein
MPNKKTSKIVIKTILSLLVALPIESKPQTMTTETASCNPEPFRVDNTFTRNPYDNIIYYQCTSIEDAYMLNKTEKQSRKTCDYIKMVYFDGWRRSWISAIYNSECKTKYYSSPKGEDTIIPEGWHPPLRVR